MKKKLFAILAVLVLSSMILSACGTPAAQLLKHLHAEEPVAEEPATEPARTSEGSQEDRVLCIRPEQRIPSGTGHRGAEGMPRKNTALK